MKMKIRFLKLNIVLALKIELFTKKANEILE